MDPVLDHTDKTVVKIAQETYSKFRGKHSSDPLQKTASQVPEDEPEEMAIGVYSSNRPSQKATPMKSEGGSSKKPSGVPHPRTMDAERPLTGTPKRD